MAPTAVLLVSCPDQPGIVAAVAGFVADHGGNVVDLQQHTDHTDAAFFQRVEFEVDGFDLAAATVEDAFAPVATRFGMRWSLRWSNARPRVGILASREPHCLHDLLNRWRTGELTIDIPVVVRNHPDHAHVAEWYDVEYHHLPVGDDRPAQEATAESVFRSHDVDLVVLARYMQVLSAGFCQRWNERVINIHHSFLPSFQGARPYHQAHERGVKLIGVTAHYATADLDDGPIIEQEVLRVTHRDDVEDLRRSAATWRSPSWPGRYAPTSSTAPLSTASGPSSSTSSPAASAQMASAAAIPTRTALPVATVAPSSAGSSMSSSAAVRYMGAVLSRTRVARHAQGATASR